MSEAENSGQTEKIRKPPLPLWRRILLVLFLAGFIAMGGLMLASYWMGRKLGQEIVKIHQSGAPLTLRDLHSTTLAPGSESNRAAQLYLQGLTMINTAELPQVTNFNSSFRVQVLTTLPDKFPPEVRQKVAEYLEMYRPILDKFDQAGRIDTCHFDLGLSQGMEVFSDRLVRAHTGALILSIRTLEKIAQGRGDEAARSAISMLKLIRVMDDQSIINTLPSRLLCAGLASEDVRLIVERTKPSSASLTELQQALSQVHPPGLLVKMLQAERAMQLNKAQNLVPESIAEQYLQGNPVNWPGRIISGNAYSRMRQRHNSVRYLRNMAQMITAADGVWPGLIDDIEAVEPQKGEQQAGMTVVEIATKVSEALARARVTSCLAAAARYQQDHNEPPASLEELVPNYIEAIPQDTFTGEKILYKLDEKSYIIYSAGRNRHDDGGRLTRTSVETVSADLGLFIGLLPAQPSTEAPPQEQNPSGE